jgi:mevalonate kinase
MSINHHLLNALGVGHPILNTVVETASSFGESHYIQASDENGPITTSSMIGKGFAAKLTGAGGGGCALILAPSITFENGEVIPNQNKQYSAVEMDVKMLIEAIK